VVAFAVLLLPGGADAGDSIQWRNLGPGGGGNMCAVGISPANPNIVLMGGDVGGIYRSGDGGLNWSLRNQALIRKDRHLGYAITQSGTANYPISGGHFAFDPTAGNSNIVYFGFQRSTDAGLNWTVNVDENLEDAAGGLIDPNNHNIVYASGYGQIFRSTDGFQSTSCTGAQTPDDPLTSVNEATVCTAGGTTCSAKSRCFQLSCLPSSTAGPSNPGCSNPVTHQVEYNYSMTVRALVLNPASPASLIACADTGLFQSTNSAQTWTKMAPTGIPGVCAGGTNRGNICQSDADCPGATCSPGICEGAATCNTDADCTNPQTCQEDGTCGTGTACNVNSQCSTSGETCRPQSMKS
jgi:hypothetical protein